MLKRLVAKMVQPLEILSQLYKQSLSSDTIFMTIRPKHRHTLGFSKTVYRKVLSSRASLT